MNFNKVVIHYLLIFLTCQIEVSVKICPCSSLLSEGDCVFNKDCQWDKNSQYCTNRVTVENPIIIKKYPTYCDQFGQNDCQKTACAWENNKCVFFTDCTVYERKTDEDCQLINNSCITDGNHCVQISACDQYKNNVPVKKMIQENFVFGIILKMNVQLLIHVINYLLHQGVIKNAETILEHVHHRQMEVVLRLESQCVWDLNKSMACFWDGGLCKDKICSNAPISMTTDNACIQFRKDGSCTTKEKGGCVIRTSCSAAKIKEACVKNAEGISCFWNGQNCLEKICKNASKTLMTNSECEEFQAGCITTSLGGFVQNRSSSAVDTLIACYKNSNGYTCAWFTFKGQVGCYEKTCENAPTSLLTNEECEGYLQGHNCITQTGGGCITQTICEAIKIEAACIQDIYGVQCIWDQIYLQCKRKSCWYAIQTDSSSSLNRLLSVSHTITQNYCQQFSDTCFANPTNTECIEKKCEDFLLQTDCLMDVLSNITCVWVEKCYQKQCVFASKATTYQECQTYLSSCTLSNSGLGCVPLPNICQQIKNKNSCIKKANGEPCGWNGYQCIDKSCSTASNLIKTTQECQSYLPQCVINDQIIMNGIQVIMGCQDLPINCRQRMTLENCEISRKSYPKCLWNPLKNQCVEKSCETASMIGIISQITQFTFQNCKNYLSDNSCIVNNNSDGCMSKQSSCRDLVYQNCQLGSKRDGDCYWNGLECVDRTCQNLKFTTHNDCNGQQIECTVNNQKTGCQRLAFQCSDYSDYENCKLTSKIKYCIWTGSVCRSATCFDASDSQLYDTDEECSNYQSNEKCTVISKVGGQGCINKQANCSDYKISGQCHKTIQNSTTKDDCKWIIDTCYSILQLISQPCSILKGSKQMCQKFNDGCTNTDQADSFTPCILDCQLKIGQKLTFEDCQKLDKSCSVRIDGYGCIPIKPTCQEYGSQSIGCVRSSAIGTQSYCVMVTVNPPYCQTIKQASECTFVISSSSLDHEKCQAYSSFCTYLNNGSGCQEYKNTCNLYSGDLQHCTISKQGKCYFDGTECVRFLMCSSITGIGITNELCSSYNQGCTSNANGTACQQKQVRCDLYSTQNSCTLISTSTIKCVWAEDACVAITTSIVQTHCLYVIGTQLTDALCSVYNLDCTVNADGTACQRKQATCDLYFSKNSCTFSKAAGSASKCIWNATSCLAITSQNIETLCAYIPGNNLTDSICSSYSSGCTINNSGSACQYMLSACDKYSNVTACSKSSAQKCVWNPDASPAQCIAVTAATQCVLIIANTTFNDIECSSYNTLCIANSTGKACQEKKATCNIYTTSESCTTSTAGKCYWNSTVWPEVCIQISNASSLCISVVQPYPLSKNICTTFNTGCTVNSLKTGCQELQNTCDLYLTHTTCSFSKAKSPADVCVWNTELSPAVCIAITNANQCTLILGSDLDNTQCQAQFTSCTNLKDGTGCQEKKSYCKNYSTQNTCVMQNDGTSCLWFENSCYQIRTLGCSSITGVGLNHSSCQSYNISCTSMADGNSCQELKSTCEQYLGTNSCTKTPTSKCYQDKQKCITISNPTTDCSKITGTQGTITYQYCQSYNIGCSVNRLKSGCIQQQQQCSGYNNNIENCYQSKSGLCISSSTADNSCISVSQITNCENLYLGDGNYNHQNCNQMKNECTVNGIIGCTIKTCGNAIGPFNHENCKNWLNSCTVYIGKNGCITMKQKCMDQQAVQCLNSFEGECVVVGQQCLKKTCDTASSDTTHDDDSECSEYLQSCTVARIGGCQPRSNCSSYISQSQCKLNSSGKKCFWNKTIQNCVDLKCENIEATVSYDSHDECFAVDQQLTCTVKASEGIAIAGCISLQSCDSYTIEEQCVTNQNGDICVWNTNQSLEKPQCQDKSCTTAPFSLSTHYECYSYYNTPTVQCTVALNVEQDGILILSGCQVITSCSSYTNIEQCKINDKGKPCEWQSTQCLEKSCDTAPLTNDYDSDNKCKNYFGDKCTVASSGLGCTTIPQNCEEMTKEQCFYNNQGNPCFWTGNSCITKTCDNVPESMQTPDKCESYLSECTIDNIKCKIKVCEHYNLTTDYECTQVKSTCTTNGKFCVQRGACFESSSEAGCKISSQGDQCQWIKTEKNSNGYCTMKSCSTAPYTLNTEEQCANYYNNCTAKYGGGCTIKFSCYAAQIKTACTRDNQNKICIWDQTENKCRYQECIDINGTSHLQCKFEKLGCTVGFNGKCARILSCELTTIREACIEGINGPCLWIVDKNNQSKGKCIKYTSCQSVLWQTDEECKLIQCSETNTNGGCVTGFDGVCAQSKLNQNNLYSKICSLESSFSCQIVSYITHTECQNYSIKCTTNGTGCISLMPCALYYSQSGCFINKAGQILDNSNNILSTGICIWESTISACRDQNCFDLIGNNHSSCYDQLLNCTSNGSTCIPIEQCTYHQTQTACIVAKSLDDPCFWEQDSNLCRPLICPDIKNVSITSNCQLILPSCVSDGINCVPKSNCSEYKTKTSCYSYGLDGPCVFYNNQYCKQITECIVAQYYQACEQVQNVCYWVPQSDQVYPSNFCKPHTCETYYATFRVCNFFFKFNYQTKIICQFKNNQCNEADPLTFLENDCYKGTGYSYTWNFRTNRCQSCFAKTIPKTNESNKSNETNTTNATTDKAYLLAMVLAFQNLFFA